jgi:hypothetical protein
VLAIGGVLLTELLTVIERLVSPWTRVAHVL